MDYSAVSVAGRREQNEDSTIAVQIGGGILLAVADGLGGHAAGEVASAIAVNCLKTVFTERCSESMDEEDLKELLIYAFQKADSEILKQATGKKKGMGTTLVAAYVRNGGVVCANTGDSRLYHFSRTLKQVTIDHSLVQTLVFKGLVDRKAARFHPMKNIINHSIGGDFTVDTFCFKAEIGDEILLSSDGLHDYLDDEDIEKTLLDGTADEIAKGLIIQALKESNDNITAVVLKI